MATKKKQTAIEVKQPAALSDELADVLGDEDLETDGLEEVDAEDIKIPAKIFNMKGTDANKEPIQPNVFYDTVTEDTQRTLDGVLLTLVKSNAWSEYDESEARNKVICRSSDRIAGVMMETGEHRQCKGCPDAQWHNIDGKRKRNCGPVYTLIGIEDESQLPFVLRCKKTSLPPFQQYLNRFFIGRRVVDGTRCNYPLFSFRTSVSLAMDDTGKYAIPKFERGDVLGRDEIRFCAEQAKFYRGVVMPLMDKLDQVHEGGDAPTQAPASEPRGVPSDFLDDAPAQQPVKF